jgi:hypothetical protein
MILPSKFLDPSVSVLQVSASILAMLARSPVSSLNELRGGSLRHLPNRASQSFHGALGLLFLLGLIDYDAEADAVVRLVNKGTT